MNCIVGSCKHQNCIGDDWYCKFTNQEVPDNIIDEQCEHYVLAHTCCNCENARPRIIGSVR